MNIAYPRRFVIMNTLIYLSLSAEARNPCDMGSVLSSVSCFQSSSIRRFRRRR